ncbi:MAG TPA: PAS domain S-box protein [Acidimicrobiales bacterium]|nr:PAS domain S-box protein [Acidimicrobiales bacterium]
MDPSEDVLRGLLGAAPDALLAVDEAGTIVFVNDQAERVFGWPRADLIGKPVECLVPERFAGRHPDLRAGYMEHPTTRPMGVGLELWARRRDGTEFPAEISLSGFTTAEGSLLVAAAIRDVTVSRRTEHRYRAVLASAPDATIGVDASGRIELLNAQAERLLGWTAGELLGQQVEVLVPEADRDQHALHRAGYVADPEARPMGAGGQLSARRKDGTTFPAEISLSAVHEAPGSVLVLASIRDVTERIELAAERQRAALEAQRERSHRLESLGQLAGGIAHDFNNLLGVILNYTALLSRRATDPATGADLGEIRAAAERGAALTRQLLTFARRDVANPERVDVNDVVRGVVAMLERTLGEPVELRLELWPGSVIAIVDRQQIEQIVINLAINSRDAMPHGGQITIATERVEGELDIALRVADTGEGMPPEVVKQAFEPFFTTKPHGKGTGLGLATVYGIVRQNGGEVRIDSEVGAGTTVTIGLRSADDPAARQDVTGIDLLDGRERILLVEDEKSLRVATARILTGHGYQVIAASDGVEALEFLDDEPDIDVVVTDIAMPRMRGDELARVIGERRPGTRVIMMTGYNKEDGPTSGRLLAKPVAEEELLRAIREVVDGGA